MEKARSMIANGELGFQIRSVLPRRIKSLSGFAAKLSHSQAKAIAGIWPEYQSYDDSYMAPIPWHWKGICQEGELFNSSNYNRKIIDTRWYIKAYKAEFGLLNRSSVREFLSPRNASSRGTHTSSTAVGSFVDDVSLLGLAPGSARGVGPAAHIATYKIQLQSPVLGLSQ